MKNNIIVEKESFRISSHRAFALRTTKSSRKLLRVTKIVHDDKSVVSFLHVKM